MQGQKLRRPVGKSIRVKSDSWSKVQGEKFLLCEKTFVRSKKAERGPELCILGAKLVATYPKWSKSGSDPGGFHSRDELKRPSPQKAYFELTLKRKKVEYIITLKKNGTSPSGKASVFGTDIP